MTESFFFFFRLLRRPSTTFPWQTDKLLQCFSVSLQDTHIGTVSLCFLPFIYFPLFLCLLSHPPTLSLSVLFTAVTTLSSPLNLKSESFPSFFSHHCLATVSTAYIFYICLYFIVCMNVFLFFCFLSRHPVLNWLFFLEK